MTRRELFSLGLLLVLISPVMGQTVKIDSAELEQMMQLPQEDWLNLTLMGTKIG